MHMAKSRYVHVAVSLPRLIIVATLIGALLGGTELLPQPAQTKQLHPQTAAAKKNPTPYTAAPQTASKPAPAPTPQAVATTPKPVAIAHATHTSKAAPVVKAAASASVTGLKPVNPTPSPGGTSSTGSGSPAPPLTTTAYTSSNWSGYFAATDTYTSVSGSWSVPTVTGISRHTSSDAAWIGIGGVTSGDLIQVGTQDTVSRSGTQTSSAFYELLPASAETITSLSVNPGDSMNASLAEVSSGHWVISITDSTTGKTYSTTVSYTSSHSSAEWIEEDPSNVFGSLVPFDNFGTVSFSGATTATTSGTLSLDGSNAQPITMVAGSSAVASPSAIGGDGKSFTVTRM